MQINIVPKITSSSASPLQQSVPDKIDVFDSHQIPPDLRVEMLEIDAPQSLPQPDTKNTSPLASTLQQSVPDKIDIPDPHHFPSDLGVEMLEIHVPQNLPQLHPKAKDTLLQLSGNFVVIWMKTM